MFSKLGVIYMKKLTSLHLTPTSKRPHNILLPVNIPLPSHPFDLGLMKGILILISISIHMPLYTNDFKILL